MLINTMIQSVLYHNNGVVCPMHNAQKIGRPVVQPDEIAFKGLT